VAAISIYVATRSTSFWMAASALWYSFAMGPASELEYHLLLTKDLKHQAQGSRGTLAAGHGVEACADRPASKLIAES